MGGGGRHSPGAPSGGTDDHISASHRRGRAAGGDPGKALSPAGKRRRAFPGSPEPSQEARHGHVRFPQLGFWVRVPSEHNQDQGHPPCPQGRSWGGVNPKQLGGPLSAPSHPPHPRGIRPCIHDPSPVNTATRCAQRPGPARCVRLSGHIQLPLGHIMVMI